MEDLMPDLNNLGRAEAEALRDRLRTGTLTSTEAGNELTRIWATIAARPGMLLTPEEWRDLWQYAGHIHLYRETRGGRPQWKLTERPSTKVRLYRSSNAEFKAHPSWTTDQEQAKKWLDGDTVWTAEFEPERLLATADLYPDTTTKETEYIAYTGGLDLDIHLYRAVAVPVSPNVD